MGAKLTDRQRTGRKYIYITARESIEAYEPDPDSDYYFEEMEQKQIVINQIESLLMKFCSQPR